MVFRKEDFYIQIDSSKYNVIKYTDEWKERYLEFLHTVPSYYGEEWNKEKYKATMIMLGTKEDDLKYLAINKKQEIIGYARAFIFSGNSLLITELFVDKRENGNRLGEALMQMAFSERENMVVYAIGNADEYYRKISACEIGSVYRISQKEVAFTDENIKAIAND